MSQLGILSPFGYNPALNPLYYKPEENLSIPKQYVTQRIDTENLLTRLAKSQQVLIDTQQKIIDYHGSKLAETENQIQEILQPYFTQLIDRLIEAEKVHSDCCCKITDNLIKQFTPAYTTYLQIIEDFGEVTEVHPTEELQSGERPEPEPLPEPLPSPELYPETEQESPSSSSPSLGQIPKKVPSNESAKPLEVMRKWMKDMAAANTPSALAEKYGKKKKGEEECCCTIWDCEFWFELWSYLYAHGWFTGNFWWIILEKIVAFLVSRNVITKSEGSRFLTDIKEGTAESKRAPFDDLMDRLRVEEILPPASEREEFEIEWPISQIRSMEPAAE